MPDNWCCQKTSQMLVLILIFSHLGLTPSDDILTFMKLLVKILHLTNRFLLNTYFAIKNHIKIVTAPG